MKTPEISRLELMTLRRERDRRLELLRKAAEESDDSLDAKVRILEAAQSFRTAVQNLKSRRLPIAENDVTTEMRGAGRG